MEVDQPWENPFGAMPVRAGVSLRLVDRGTDYPALAQWWKGHGWPPVPARHLPALGVIAVIDDADCAAAWAYMDNSGSGVAMIEWIVTNPAVSPRAAVRAIRAAVEWLRWRCAEDDLRFVFFLSTCRQPALARVLEGSGFRVTDSEMIHMVSHAPSPHDS